MKGEAVKWKGEEEQEKHRRLLIIGACHGFRVEFRNPAGCLSFNTCGLVASSRCETNRITTVFDLGLVEPMALVLCEKIHC